SDRSSPAALGGRGCAGVERASRRRADAGSGRDGVAGGGHRPVAARAASSAGRAGRVERAAGGRGGDWRRLAAGAQASRRERAADRPAREARAHGRALRARPGQAAALGEALLRQGVGEGDGRRGRRSAVPDPGREGRRLVGLEPETRRAGEVNVPNLLTGARLVAVPVFVGFFLRGDRKTALFVFVGAMITDALDGILARALKQFTRIGALLDPV